MAIKDHRMEIRPEELIKTPTIEVKVLITDTGFQADFYIGETPVHIMCRDIDTSFPKERIVMEAYKVLYDALEEWRNFK